MGMTIDEHKEHLLDIMDSMPDDACGDWRDSLAYAIDTMRKYQKIEEIVKQQDYDRFNSHNYYGYFLRVQDIRKVLEDGKID